MKSHTCVTWFFLFFSLLMSPYGNNAVASTPTPVAMVVAVRGEVEAIDTQGNRNLSMKDPVFESDRIKTGKRSKIQLMFTDNSLISLGRNTEMKISEYKWDAENKSGAIQTEIKEGTFRVMGGALAQFTPKTFTTKTPSATIGIRGSMYAGTVDGLSLSVLFQGGKGIDIRNDFGTVAITKPGFGTHILDPNQPPPPPEKFSTEDLAHINEGLTGDTSPKDGEPDAEGDTSPTKGDQPPPDKEGDEKPPEDKEDPQEGDKPPADGDKPPQEGDPSQSDDKTSPMDENQSQKDGENPPQENGEPPPDNQPPSDGAPPPKDPMNATEGEPHPPGQMVMTPEGEMVFVPEGTPPPEGSVPPPEGQMVTTAEGQMVFVPDGAEVPANSTPMPDEMGPPPAGQIVYTQEGDLMFVPEGMEPPDGSTPPPEGMSMEGQVILIPKDMPPPPQGMAGEPMIDPMTGEPMMPPPDGMTGQPMMDPATGEPMMDPMTGEPMMPPPDGMAGQPMMDPMTGEPMMPPPDGMTGQPMMDPMTGEPMMPPPDGMTGQPMMDPMTGEPMMPPPDGMAGQPMMDPMTGVPMMPPPDGMAGQPMMDPMGGTFDPMMSPTYDPMMSPMYDPMMPMYDPMMDPMYDPMMQMYDPMMQTYDPMMDPMYDPGNYYDPTSDPANQSVASGDPNAVPTSMPSNGIDGYVGNFVFSDTGDTLTAMMEVNWLAGTGFGIMLDTNFPGPPAFFFGQVSGTSLTNIKLFGTTGPQAHEASGTGVFKGANHQYFDMSIGGLSYDLTTLGSPVIGGGWSALATTGITPQHPEDVTAPTGVDNWKGYVVAISENVNNISQRKSYMNSTDSDVMMTIDRNNGVVTGSIDAPQLTPTPSPNPNAKINVSFGGAGKSAYILDDHFGAIIDSGGVEDDTIAVTNPLNPHGNYLTTEDPDKNNFEYMSWGYWEISHRERGPDNIAGNGDDEMWHTHLPYSMWIAGEKTPSAYVENLIQTTTFIGNYTGFAQGSRMINGGGVQFLPGGTLNLNVDFSKGTASPQAGLDHAITGSIVFPSKTLTIDSLIGDLTSSGFHANIVGATTSAVNGSFYGPNVNSVGGNFNAEFATETYLGIFGGNLTNSPPP